MKKIRIRIITLLLLGVLLIGTSTSLAATNATMPIDQLNAMMHGYIDFLEGPLTIADKVYYNGKVSGSDADKIVKREDKNYVQAGTDKKDLTKKVVYYNHPVEVSGAKCGYGGSYGYLNMSCEGCKRKIVS